MIFVTVGTHEQQFNRLLEYVDKLKAKGIIEDEVVMQTGFSTYQPVNCKWSRLLSYQDMQKNIAAARIVITHGGPSSFVAPLQMGKIPIVVPRQKQFGEHVNDHQADFCRAVKERQQNILLVEKIAELEDMIVNYEKIIDKMPVKQQSNNKRFNEEFESIVNGLSGTAVSKK